MDTCHIPCWSQLACAGIAGLVLYSGHVFPLAFVSTVLLAKYLEYRFCKPLLISQACPLSKPVPLVVDQRRNA